LELVEDDEESSINAPAPAASVPTPQAHVDEQVSPEAVETEPVPQQQAEAQVDDAAPSEEDKIRETGRLYLRNLHFEVTEDELREQFSKHGSLEEVSTFFFRFYHPPMQ
jgi:multiple RNA-binding domain-containing protein 1